VKWQQNMDDEARWMSEINEDIADPNDALVIAKHCSANGGCYNQRPTGNQAAGGNDGRAYIRLLQRGVKVVFLEYNPDLSWAYNDSQAFTAVFGQRAAMPSERTIKYNAMTVLPNNIAGGEMLGRLFCRQTEKEKLGRRIAIVRGNAGHVGCDARVTGFKKAVAEHCHNKSHTFPWDIYANFEKARAQELSKSLYILDATVESIVACNDDMAMGAIDAAREVRGEAVNKFLVVGFDNLSDNIPYLHPEQAVPTMFATVSWRDEYVAALKNLAELYRPVHRALPASPQPAKGDATVAEDIEFGTFMDACEAAKGCPIRKTREVLTPVETEVAQLCSYTTPQRCPLEVKALIGKGPKEWDGITPCDAGAGSHTFWDCWDVWKESLKTTIFIAVLCPAAGMLCIALKVGLLMRTEGQIEDYIIGEDDSFLKIFLETKNITSLGYVIRQWPYLFATFCALISGVQLHTRKTPLLLIETEGDPDFRLLRDPGWEYPQTCKTGFDDDSGVKYLSSLLGFLVVFRFVNLYSQRVGARQSVGQHLTSIKILATHLRGLIPRDAAKEHHWDSASVVQIRQEIYNTMLVCFKVFTMYLMDYHAGLDEDGKQEIAQYMCPDMFARYKELVLEQKEKDQNVAFRGFFYVVVAHLQKQCKLLTSMGCIQGNPQEGGQLSGQLNSIISGFTGGESHIDIFRDESGKQHPFPTALSLIGRIVVLFYCATASLSIACKTNVDAYIPMYVAELGVAEVCMAYIPKNVSATSVKKVELTRPRVPRQVCSFFIALAFCSLYQVATQLEQPFGSDETDIALDAYGKELEHDLSAILEVEERISLPKAPIGTPTGLRLVSPKRQMGAARASLMWIWYCCSDVDTACSGVRPQDDLKLHKTLPTTLTKITQSPTASRKSLKVGSDPSSSLGSPALARSQSAGMTTAHSTFHILVYYGRL
jgi:hypothetical protein